MDPATLTALIAALQSVGLGNLIVVLALAWGYRVLSKGAGTIGSFLKDALVTVGKLADKGVDIRLAVKLVDDDGACVTPAAWAAGEQPGCPTCVSPASEEDIAPLRKLPMASIPDQIKHCSV